MFHEVSPLYDFGRLQDVTDIECAFLLLIL